MQEDQGTVEEANFSGQIGSEESKHSSIVHKGHSDHVSGFPSTICRREGQLRQLNELRHELVPHPPYSPDLAPSDSFLFSTWFHLSAIL